MLLLSNIHEGSSKTNTPAKLFRYTAIAANAMTPAATSDGQRDSHGEAKPLAGVAGGESPSFDLPRFR